MTYRIERDFLGEKQIPDDAYYGIQTLRGQGELPHHGHAHLPGTVLRQGLRLREEGRGHGELRRRNQSTPALACRHRSQK